MVRWHNATPIYEFHEKAYLLVTEDIDIIIPILQERLNASNDQMILKLHGERA